jgi:amino acid transporter
VTAEPSGDWLTRALGVRQLAALIFNEIVGSGIFVLPALAAADLGAAAILAYLVCAIVMALMVLCFAEIGSRVSATGGPYAYVERAFGPLVGFVTGVLLQISSVAAAAAVALLFAGTVGAMLGWSSPLALDAVVAVVLAAVAAVNIRGVRDGARLVEIMTVAKLAPLLGLIVVGAAFLHPQQLRWTATPAAGSIMRTAGVLIFAFLGIEGALSPSGEVRNVSRTVPRAAFLAVGAIALLYIMIQTVAQGLLGAALPDDRIAPLAAAAGVVAGPLGRSIMLAGASISMAGFLCGNVLSNPRLFFAFARDGLAPQWMGRVHPAYHTPHLSIAAYVAITFVLAVSGSFEQLAIVTNVASLIVYFGCAAAVFVLRRQNVREEGEPFVVPGGPLVPALACGAIVALIAATVTPIEIAAVCITTAAALVVYFVQTRR